MQNPTEWLVYLCVCVCVWHFCSCRRAQDCIQQMILLWYAQGRGTIAPPLTASSLLADERPQWWLTDGRLLLVWPAFSRIELHGSSRAAAALECFQLPLWGMRPKPRPTISNIISPIPPLFFCPALNAFGPLVKSIQAIDCNYALELPLCISLFHTLRFFLWSPQSSECVV